MRCASHVCYWARSAMDQRYQLLTRAFQCQKMLNVPGQTLMVCGLAAAERRAVLASDAHCSAERTYRLRRAVDCSEKATADFFDAAAGLAEYAIPWAELALLRSCRSTCAEGGGEDGESDGGSRETHDG